MERLIEGRIVHFVLQGSEEHRPAIIVKVWSQINGCSNLQIITDSDAEGKFNDGCSQIMWATSVVYSEEPKVNTWHWIEGSEKSAKESDWSPIQIRIQAMDLALRCKEHSIDESSLLDLSNRISKIISGT